MTSACTTVLRESPSRYQCNQCPYRCHRADQLSSHKLRHQGKSLICEVCGFACKRKYELQKHVQAKHSQDYQMPVFQCQYCSYQTKYKQALFNHENCKHTKQREFRCALCPYRTFSNTSLFFHKRKAHGYVPGDKGWQENYASRELEVTSSGVLLSCNLAVSLHSEPSSSLPGREPWQERAKPLAAEAEEEEEEEEGHREALAPPLFGNGSAAEKREEGIVGGQGQYLVQGTPSEELSLKAASVGLEEPGGGREPVPTCTLHLEPLCDSGPVLEPLTEEMPTAVAETAGGGALSCREADSAYETLGSGDPLVLGSGQPALEDAPDFEEEAEVPGHGDVELEKDLSPSTGEGDAQSGLRGLRGTEVNGQSPTGLQEPLSPKRAAGCHEALEASPKGVKQDSLQPSPNQKAPIAPEGTLLSSSSSEEGSPPESVLRALRKQDKEQAETLVLEGRVQMLVVQSKSRVFKCEKCSYLTRKERCLLVHCKVGCQVKKGPLACQQCGATFKQQRGLNTHLRKKCPVLAKRSPGKTACLDPPPPAEPSGTSPGATELEKNGGGALEEAGASPLEETPWGVGWRAGRAESVPTLLPGNQSGATGIHDQPSPGAPETLMEERLLPAEGEPAGCHAERYRLEQGKFRCRSCSFACSRASTIRSHVEDACRASEQFCCPLCSRNFRSKRALKAHQADDGHVQGQPRGARLPEGAPVDAPPAEEKARENGRISPGRVDRPDERGAGPGAAPPPPAPPLHKRRPFSCPSCPFTCHQERALKTHRQRGCLKLGEFRCTLCPFTSKAAAALRLHRKLHRRYYGARPPLACRQCDFTCKQARCLRQHVLLKHEGVKPHKCPYCDFCTTRRYRLEAHQSLHTGVGRIACPACGQTFGTNSKLRIHRLRVHEKKPTHFCPLCDYSGYIRNDITRHVNSCHRGDLSFACGRCEARFSSETALKQHALRQHEEKASHGCPHCAFVCHSEATLKCHAQKQHSHLECATCKETLATREELEEHKKLHFSHRCELCGFAAKERQQLVSHYVEAHEPSPAEERPLRCSFCDFGCRHQLVFDHHMKGHGGTRVYKCSDCDYTTKSKQKITWHIRIHTGEKPYRCHQCQYACADPSRLKVRTVSTSNLMGWKENLYAEGGTNKLRPDKESSPSETAAVFLEENTRVMRLKLGNWNIWKKFIYFSKCNLKRETNIQERLTTCKAK